MKHLARAAPITVESHRKPRRDRWAHGARWVLAAACAVFLVVAFSGCSKRAEVQAAEDAAEIRVRSAYTYLSRMSDPDTKCEYLIYDGKALTPRIAADGKTHMGCKTGGNEK